MDNIEKQFNDIQSYFNESKKYLLGKGKNIKLAVENYDNYYLKLNNIYVELQKSYKDNENALEIIKKTYINHLTRLIKIYLLIPYFYKAKILCEQLLNLDKDNIEIIPSYIKCLHHFKKYTLITEILSKIKEDDNNIIKNLKIQNEQRIKESKGDYNLLNIYENFKKIKNYNLDLAQYMSQKISIQQDKEKGLIIVAKEDIPKGEIIIAEKAIAFFPNLDKNLKNIKIEKEERHNILKNKIKEKMLYCREDNPEIFEIYDGTNGNLSLEQRKDNYLKNILNKDINISEKTISTLFTDSFSTSFYLYDQLLFSGYGLFYNSSFFSHSCCPNTMVYGIGDFIFILTDRNIKQNEELTTFYVENDKDYFERRAMLKNQYGFDCQCELCKIEQKQLEKYPEIKKKTCDWLPKIINFSHNPNYYFYFPRIIKDVTEFLDNNKDKTINHEKGLLYYNLYYLWVDYKTNHGLLEKALECYDNEKNMDFNIMKYYCLLKMYKVDFVYKNNLCNDIKNRMLKLLKEAFGNKQNDYVEKILDDIIKDNTSDDEPDIINFRENKIFENFKENYG